jgi:hypothetical protein
MRTYLLAAIFVLIAATGRTEDAGSVAASLPDEAAECRYYLNLCKEVNTYNRQGTEALAQGNAAAARASSSLATAALMKVLDVDRVIRAKHDTPPACLKECKAE